MSRNRKTYTASFKTKLVLEILREQKTLNQIASEYNVSPSNLKNWKKQFLLNAEVAMNPATVVKEYKEELLIKQGEVEQLQKTLGKTVAEKEFLQKKLMSLESLNRKELVDSQATLPIQDQCKILEVSKSSYYRKKVVNDKKEVIYAAINSLYDQYCFYGHRKVHHMLIKQGHSISFNTVKKYRKKMKLHCIFPGKQVLTTLPREEHKKWPYLLKDLEKIDSNQVWSTDITYIKTPEGFMYLAAIIDWNSKAILSYKLSNSMDEDLVMSVLKSALNLYPKPAIMNTDQGSQYTGKTHIKYLLDAGIKVSMDGKGRATDNIMIERFWRSAKYESIYLNQYKNIRELQDGIDDYVSFYNYDRIHQSLDYKTPMEVYENDVLGNKIEVMIAA